MKPKKWTDVYPHGTKEGDEELKFFISLARNPKYQWRSISAISKEAGLTKERVEEIMNKYYKKGMVFQNPKNEDQWGYWERVPEMLPKAEKSISAKDHQDRINKNTKTSDVIDLTDGLDDIAACSVMLDPDSSPYPKNILTRYGKKNAGFPSDDCNALQQRASSDYCDEPLTDEELNAHCQKQWGKSGKNLNDYYKGQILQFDPKQITHHRIGDKRNVFYVDIKSCGQKDAEAFIIKMKEYFQRKKEVRAIEKERGYKPVEERWQAPTTDEDFWIPIRPENEKKYLGGVSDEEYFRNKLFQGLCVPKELFEKK